MFSQRSRESRTRTWWLSGAAVLAVVFCQGCLPVYWGGSPSTAKVRRRPRRRPGAGPRLDTVQLAGATGDELVVGPPPRMVSERYRSTTGKLQSAGPRCGLIAVTGRAADLLKAKDISPVLTTWGWQFEYQYETSPEGPVGLVEFIPLITGMEQGLPVVSVNVLFGLRTADDWEFALGPNVGPASKWETDPMSGEEQYAGQTVGIGLTAAVGRTFKAGPMNLPVNFAIVSNADGVRFSITFGWNMLQ